MISPVGDINANKARASFARSKVRRVIGSRHTDTECDQWNNANKRWPIAPAVTIGCCRIVSFERSGYRFLLDPEPEGNNGLAAINQCRGLDVNKPHQAALF